MNKRFMVAAASLVTSITAGFAQDAPSEASLYCSDLKQVTALALAQNRLASITGKPREGNFRDTTLPLTGWKDCAIYGPATYTCDSNELKTSDEAEKAQARTVDRILSCLAGTWSEIRDRSSPGYIVLHPARGAASITLSVDENDKKEYLVRLTLFLRRP